MLPGALGELVVVKGPRNKKELANQRRHWIARSEITWLEITFEIVIVGLSNVRKAALVVSILIELVV